MRHETYGLAGCGFGLGFAAGLGFVILAIAWTRLAYDRPEPVPSFGKGRFGWAADIVKRMPWQHEQPEATLLRKALHALQLVVHGVLL